MSSGNPGVGAFKGVEVFYDRRDKGVMVGAKYMACPCDHLECDAL